MTVLDFDSLTAAEQVALIEDPRVDVDVGCDLLDADDVFLDDVSEHILKDGGGVERGMYRTVHGTATVRVSVDLDWGSQRLRPFLKVSNDGATWYRRNLGVFLMSTPERVVDTDVPAWTVDCFDKLDVLNVPRINTYSLPAGSNIVEAVTQLIEDAGETKVAIEASDKTNPTARVMSLTDDWTELGVANELLDSIGYRGLYVDSEGWYRSEQYTAPKDMPTMWNYSTESLTTSVAEVRIMSADYYRAANVVKGIRDTVGDGDIPVDGDGIFELENPSDGLTSIAARRRRIPRLIRGEYADHASLVIAVTAALDAEKRVANHVTINVSPTPVHGHFDVVHFRDDQMPANGRYVVTGWTVPFDGSDCQLEMRAV